MKLYREWNLKLTHISGTIFKSSNATVNCLDVSSSSNTIGAPKLPHVLSGVPKCVSTTVSLPLLAFLASGALKIN